MSRLERGQHTAGCEGHFQQAHTSGEADEGVRKLWQLYAPTAPQANKATPLLHAYLAMLQRFNHGDALDSYPGSPFILHEQMRPQDQLKLFELMPADARLAGLYTQSCKTCHADPATGAPLVGDAQAWAPRLAQGPDVLLASVISGKNAMPAGGQCFACTPDDFKALTQFMSEAKP